MFDYILGLPMHALVIHAVVVLVPLAALLALTFAARPRWRHLLRWPLAVGGVFSGAIAFVAAESGRALEPRVLAVRQSTTNLDLLREHTEWGDRTKVVALVFMVLCVAAAWFVRSARLPGRRAGQGTHATGTTGSAGSAVELPLLVLLVIGAVVTLVSVAITGHAGAVVTWDGLG